MKRSKFFILPIAISVIGGLSAVEAQDFNPFSSGSNVGQPSPARSENNGNQPPSQDEIEAYIKANTPAPQLVKMQDTVFALIRSNIASLRNTGRLDIKSSSLTELQNAGLESIITTYSEKYTEPEAAAKNLMCNYFNSPQNENEPVKDRALNAFELLESQEDMEAYWEATGEEFMKEVRFSLGEEVYQVLQTERDAINAKYGVSATQPMTSKKFILQSGADIRSIVIGNCTGSVD